MTKFLRWKDTYIYLESKKSKSKTTGLFSTEQFLEESLIIFWYFVSFIFFPSKHIIHCNSYSSFCIIAYLRLFSFSKSTKEVFNVQGMSHSSNRSSTMVRGHAFHFSNNATTPLISSGGHPLTAIFRPALWVESRGSRHPVTST